MNNKKLQTFTISFILIGLGIAVINPFDTLSLPWFLFPIGLGALTATLLPFYWEQENPIRFCKNCKYMKIDDQSHLEYCLHLKSLKEKNTRDYLVSGVAEDDKFFLCSTMRAYGCGNKARYFKPKC